MTTWDLNRIRYGIRKITGKYDTSQLPDTSEGEITISNPAGIDDYINDYYLYDMPEDLRSLRLRDFYTFTTVPNCGTYSIPQNINQIYAPIYIDNYQFNFYQDPALFYNEWPEFNFIDQNLFTPNGVLNTYTFTLSQTPVQQGTVVIGLHPNQEGNPSALLETFTDQDQPIPLDIPVKQYFVNPAPLTGNQGGVGTIDYLTGVCTINYAITPPFGVRSSCHYHPYVASRPYDIMCWQQQLFLRPIPIDTYSVKLMAYMLPTTVISAATNATIRPSLYVDPATTPISSPTNTTVQIQGFSGNSGSTSTDLPQFNEFFQLIIYGASLKIFAEDGDWEEHSNLEPRYEKAKLLVQRKTLKQLAQNRIKTRYCNDGKNGGNYWPIWPQY
jgi:hypothetical protein